MGIRNVLRIGHPALRTCAAEIPDDWFGSQRLQQLIDDLFDTKLACSGAGLAAPQIDEPWRIFVVGMGHKPRYPEADPLPELVLINPVIKSIGKELISGWEGCLRVPGLRGEVQRWQRIQLNGKTEKGLPIQKSCKISTPESFSTKTITWMVYFSLTVLPVH